MEHDGLEPIADDELLYRRVSASAHPPRYDPNTKKLTYQAFAPHKTEDRTGISLLRAKFKSVDEAAKGRAGKSYYVAELRVGDIIKSGMSVETRPYVPGGYDPAHVELPDLNSENRKQDRTAELQRVLVDLCREVHGPFHTPS